MLFDVVLSNNFLEILVDLRLQGKLLRPVRLQGKRVGEKVRCYLFLVSGSFKLRIGEARTSHPQPGYEFNHHVPPIWVDFSISWKFLVPY